MSDEAPLIFAAKLGGLFPVNPAAKEALQGVQGQCVVKITRATRNQRRRSLYWIVCGIVAGLLNDMHELTLSEIDLHDITRRKLGVYETVTLPSGEEYIKLRSTSDRAMSEPDRAVYTTKAFDMWSKWIGVPVETLTREAEAA
jgi:hypothetical protein